MASAFVECIAAGSPVEDALQPALEAETDLRRLFATECTHNTLSDPYLGLIDIFAAPPALRTAHPRNITDDLDTQHVFPLPASGRRAPGERATVSNMAEFLGNWGVFSEGSLSQLSQEDWKNVVAAGGSVLACVEPLSAKDAESKRAMRKCYHANRFPTSDVDLFLWGLTPEEAERKIVRIYEAVRDSVPWEVTCVRTRNTVSIHSQYPYRTIQIVLRLYTSPAEILAGFDVDAACIAYDGWQNKVYASARGLAALLRQCNMVDMTRRSPSYEVRLAKYARRGYEVHVPSLRRKDVDPCIFERALPSVTGLARLLVLEKLTSEDERAAFLDARRKIRGRPQPLERYQRQRRKRKYKGDLKEQNAFPGLDMNDYDVAQLHIPYGPGWNARRIERLVYQTDLGMNSTFNPNNKGRRLHRHPAFFGTGAECLDDCCEMCPQPIDEDEKKLFGEESEHYITGRVTFMQDDPGRQLMTGSFHPIDVGEWSEQVYVGATERLFAAIARDDLAAVQSLLPESQIQNSQGQAQFDSVVLAGAEELADVNRRDHVGRSPLHFAILCRSTALTNYLIGRGARITARLVDGRTSLHLAAQMDLGEVVQRLVEKSRENEAKAEADGQGEEDDKKTEGERVRDSSEDDWSSADDGVISIDDTDHDDGNDEDEDEGSEAKAQSAKEKEESKDTPIPGDIPASDDTSPTPDIIDLNLPDWDFAFTPLAYAVLYASPAVVQFFVEVGADVNMSTKGNYKPAPAMHPLSLTTVREDEDAACEIAKILLKAGASSSYADEDLMTIFHRAVERGKLKLVQTFLEEDPKARVVLDFPRVDYQSANFPPVTAVKNRDWSMLAVLLANGAQCVWKDEEFKHVAVIDRLNQYNWRKDSKISNSAITPVEAALAMHDDILHVLVDVGADINVGTMDSLNPYTNEEHRRTFLDYARYAIDKIEGELEKNKKEARGAEDDQKRKDKKTLPSLPETKWQTFAREFYYTAHKRSSSNNSPEAKENEAEAKARRDALEQLKSFFVSAEKLFESHGGKTWEEVHDSQEKRDSRGVKRLRASRLATEDKARKRQRYLKLTARYSSERLSDILNDAYDELFEAAYTGDRAKIRELCLPSEEVAAKNNRQALQIAVEMDVSDSSYGRSTGLTPLVAAILGKQWDTAKLIVSISIAQHDPEKKDSMVNAGDFDFDDDSEDGSDTESCGSEETADGKEVGLVDVANTPVTVKSEVPPEKMISELAFSWPGGHGNLLKKAVIDNDNDAFLRILELYSMTPLPVALDEQTLNTIIENNRPDMLDEYIRRSGLGLQPDHAEIDDSTLAMNDQNRLYLGLNVHGKKRKDLAKEDKKNRETDTPFVPLVWRAAQRRAPDVLDYLAGDRPLAAYRVYAKSNPDQWLARLKVDLAEVLPKWLGWTVSSTGESCLTAAVLSASTSIFKKVVKHSPKAVTATLHNCVPVTGHNLLMILTEHGILSNGKTSLYQHLLDISVSPAERDTIRGWNIFHILCDKKTPWDMPTLRFYLKKLPEDVVTALLEQSSKHRLETPLHIAVRRGNIAAVELLLPFLKASDVLLRGNINGFTPLALAVFYGFSKATERLLETCPRAMGVENTVGQTAVYISLLKELVLKTQGQPARHRRNGTTLPAEIHGLYDVREELPDAKDIADGCKRLKATLKKLENEGRFSSQDVISKAFAQLLAYAEEKDYFVVEADQKTEKDRFEQTDHVRTLEVLRAATGSAPRGLVHISEVQRAAQFNLARSKQSKQIRDDGGLEEELPEDGPLSRLVFKEKFAKRMQAEDKLGA